MMKTVLQDRMEKINGNYQVGLDFAAFRQASANANEDVARDRIYNDWIVKIVPGIGDGGGDEEAERVICEDLGVLDDFDFNDVVFDVTPGDGGVNVKIVHLGGTLPITVAGQDVHALAGDTKENGLYHILGDVQSQNITFFVDNVENALDIPIVVSGITAAGQTVGDNVEATSTVTLDAEEGKVPQKICVTPKYSICSERQGIDKRYTKFADYVADPMVEWY